MKKYVLLALILSLSNCSAVEVYGGIRRTDTIETRTTTTAPKTSWTDAVTDWLFVNHEAKKA